jgi:hypothetical protein
MAPPHSHGRAELPPNFEALRTSLELSSLWKSFESKQPRPGTFVATRVTTVLLDVESTRDMAEIDVTNGTSIARVGFCTWFKKVHGR